MDDQLVIFSTNGECVIYSGIDPDSDFSLVGIFRFDSPMSKHCVVNYGGDLYVPDLDRAGADVDADAGRERAARPADKNVFSAFSGDALAVPRPARLAGDPQPRRRAA